MSTRRCPSCATELRATARFCDGCGRPVAAASDQRDSATQLASTSRVEPDDERKTITALFADIKGSMALIEDLDPEDAGKIVDPAMRVMMDAIHRYEGTVVQTTGDGIFAMFGAPIAHEDHAHRALLAALRMQADVAAYAKELRRDRGVTLQIRVGINTGEVVVRSISRDDQHVDYTPVGHATGLAARMEQLADAGSIVVSEHTHRLTEGYFSFRPLGPARVKGLSAPIQIYELVGIGALRSRLDRSRQRGLVPFVGRNDELERLQALLGRAAAGEGQLLRIEGEPGIGKSRLTHELCLLAESRFGVLAGAAVAHGANVPYATIIDLLKSYFDVHTDDDARRRREKITGRVLTLDRAFEDVLPYVFTLLDAGDVAAELAQMDPLIRRERTQDALVRVVLREAEQRPVLLIVEDLHWLDAESEAVLDGIAARLDGVPIMVAVNYRPEYCHVWPASRQTHLQLGPLDSAQGAQLVRTLLGPRADLDSLQQLILDRTGGNPFFIEEIVQSLREQNVIGEETASSSATLQIPATVHDVLAARIDRLAPADKSLLQSLAVLGRQFSAPLGAELAATSTTELLLQVERLQHAEFLTAPVDEGDVITFKHALTQEVAYGTLLSDRRRDLHRRAAQAIERRHGARLEPHYGELARHYRLAHEAEQSSHYFQLAGDQAFHRSAYRDAVHHLSAAIELHLATPASPERDRQELLLQIRLGRALMLTKGWESAEAENTYARARQLIDEVGNAPHVFPALGGLFGFYSARGQFQLARELAARAMDLSERFGHGVVARWAQYMLAQVSFYTGEFTSVRSLLEPWLSSSEAGDVGLSAAMGVEDFLVGALAHLAPTLWFLGYPDQAVMRAEQGVERARGLDHPFSLAYALLALAQVHQYRGESAAVRRYGEELTGVAERHGLLYGEAGVVLCGWARTQDGAVTAGIEMMRSGLAGLRAKGIAVRLPNVAHLADALRRTGEVGEGLEIIAAALQVVARTGETQTESLLLRIRGDLLAEHSDHTAEAEQCYRRAIHVAQAQAAKSLELQAVLAATRLWRRNGREQEARAHLAPLVDWFTEGAETADLREARRLQAEL